MNAVAKRLGRAGLSRMASAQAAIVAGALGWLLLAPPASGQIMLLPLTPHAARSLPATVLHGGDTRLIGPGPLPGSLLVEARRADLAGLLVDHATLALASQDGGCGADTGP